MILSLALANNDSLLLGSNSQGSVYVWLFQDLLMEVLSSKEERDIFYTSICKLELKEGKIMNLKLVPSLDGLFFNDESNIYFYSWSDISNEIKDKVSLRQQNISVTKFKSSEKAKYSITQDFSHNDVKIQSIEYDETSETIYIGSNYGEIAAISMQDLKLVKWFSPISNSFAIDSKEIAISSIKVFDEQSIVFGNHKGNIELWDIKEEKRIRSYKLDKENLSSVTHLELEKDKKWIITAHNDYIIRWHSSTGIVDTTIMLDSDITSLSLQGSSIVTGHAQNTFYNWNIENGEFESKVESSSEFVTTLLGMSEGKNKLVVVGGSGPIIDVFSNNKKLVCYTC